MNSSLISENQENRKNPENYKTIQKEEFDYLKSLRETSPHCVIDFIIDNFYSSQAVPNKDYRYKWTYKNDQITDTTILVLCVLIKKPILSKLIIYYQHSQWQYLRYDYEDGDWNPIICSFLDLRDCVDIFEDKKERVRFIRTIWDCRLNWILPEKDFNICSK